MNWENEVDKIIGSNLKQGSVSIGKDWLTRAIEQKNAHLTVGVAYSAQLVFDRLDAKLLAAIHTN